MGWRDVSPAYCPSYFAMCYLYRFIHSLFLNLTSFQELEPMTITYVQVVDFGQRSQ